MAELSEAEPSRKEIRTGCTKCNYTGVFAGKLGGRWTYYPQIRCECRSTEAGRRALSENDHGQT